MSKLRLRRTLLQMSGYLETGSRKLRGVAHHLSPGMTITMADCEKQNWRNTRPAFVLSTGRAGTLLLNRLLLISPDAFAEHQPLPELIRASKRAYEEIEQSPEIFAETFKSAREEIVCRSVQTGKVFIETNNRITFFAPVIRTVFPEAVFIHLVRHPGDFVRSGIRRQWYSGKHDHDFGRILPNDKQMKSKWQTLSSIEKIGWLWNETNQFIESFKKTIASDNILFVKAEELFTQPAVTEKIFDFLQLSDYDSAAVSRVLRKPANVQHKGSFPEFECWTIDDKEQLIQMAPLAERYGYAL